MLSRLSTRAASSAASPRVSPLAAPFDIRSSRLPSGVLLSSVDLDQPVAHLSISFRAGPRFQQPDEGGFAHRLRNAFGGDSRRARGLTMLWQAGSVGAEIKAAMDREHLTLNISLPREHVVLGISLLTELAQPKLEPWELEDLKDGLIIDRKLRTVEEKALQLLHEAAYRNGPLAQSLLCRHHELGGVHFSRLQSYANSRLAGSECAVGAVNVDHSILLNTISETPFIEAAHKPVGPSPFRGGDKRHDSDASRVAVAVAGETAGSANNKDLATNAVLRAVLAKVLPSGVSPFFLPYSDTGLIGFTLVDRSTKNASELVNRAVDAFKSLGSSVDGKVLDAAKQSVRVGIHSDSQNGVVLSSSVASSLLVGSAPVLPADLAEQVAEVDSGAVSASARAATARLSLGAHGNISQIPYLDGH